VEEPQAVRGKEKRVRKTIGPQPYVAGYTDNVIVTAVSLDRGIGKSKKL